MALSLVVAAVVAAVAVLRVHILSQKVAVLYLLAVAVAGEARVLMVVQLAVAVAALDREIPAVLELLLLAVLVAQQELLLLRLDLVLARRAVLVGVVALLELRAGLVTALGEAEAQLVIILLETHS
jgi:hypothetical protein